jgi:hypothetical protein
MEGHRLQIQGLSEDDYDKVYLAGYQDGIEQQIYVSDHELADVRLECDYDSHIVRVIFSGDQQLVAFTRTAFKNMIYTAQQGEYTYLFEED